MIKIILVPVDGTDRSAEVLDTALVIAKRFDAHIKVVHVRELAKEPYMFGGVPKNYREEFARMSRKAVETLVDEIRKKFNTFCSQNKVKVTRKPSAAKGVSASLHVFEGDP